MDRMTKTTYCCEDFLEYARRALDERIICRIHYSIVAHANVVGFTSIAISLDRQALQL
jgi:hypothetical protein